MKKLKQKIQLTQRVVAGIKMLNLKMEKHQEFSGIIRTFADNSVCVYTINHEEEIVGPKVWIGGITKAYGTGLFIFEQNTYMTDEMYAEFIVATSQI